MFTATSRAFRNRPITSATLRCSVAATAKEAGDKSKTISANAAIIGATVTAITAGIASNPSTDKVSNVVPIGGH